MMLKVFLLCSSVVWFVRVFNSRCGLRLFVLSILGLFFCRWDLKKYIGFVGLKN